MVNVHISSHYIIIDIDKYRSILLIAYEHNTTFYFWV